MHPGATSVLKRSTVMIQDFQIPAGIYQKYYHWRRRCVYLPKRSGITAGNFQLSKTAFFPPFFESTV